MPPRSIPLCPLTVSVDGEGELLGTKSSPT